MKIYQINPTKTTNSIKLNAKLLNWCNNQTLIHKISKSLTGNCIFWKYRGRFLFLLLLPVNKKKLATGKLKTKRRKGKKGEKYTTSR